MIKKEFSTRRGSSRRSLLGTFDRRRLEASIPSSAHRGLRMLCSREVLNLDIDCPVDTAEGEYSCVRISNVRLDVNKIQELVEPIVRKLVNPPDNDEIFDKIAEYLLYLDMNIPGLDYVFSQGSTDEGDIVSVFVDVISCWIILCGAFILYPLFSL